MKSVIVLCLVSFSFGAPRPKNESIIPIERENVEEFTDDKLIGIGVKQVLKELKQELKELKIPEVEIEKLLEKGIDLETLFREVIMDLDLVNLVKKAIAAGEALTNEDVEVIFGEAFNEAFSKTPGELFDLLPNTKKFLEKGIAHEDFAMFLGEVFELVSNDDKLREILLKEALIEIVFNFERNGLDIKKLLEKGLDMKTLFEDVILITVFDVELVRRAIAGEEVATLGNEKFAQGDFDMLLGKAFKGVDLKTIVEVFGHNPKIIGIGVKEALNEFYFNKALPGVDIEKLLEKGINVETLLEDALTGLDLEKLVEKALAGEDVEALAEDALTQADLEIIFSGAIKEVFAQGLVSGHKVVSPVIGPVFYYTLLLDNGIAETRIGSEGPNGTSIMEGSFTIPLGRGDVAVFNWVADENGYRVESPYLPTPPPAPPHVAELLRIAEEQRAASKTFER